MTSGGDDDTPKPPTESQRIRHDREWSSGIPVVKKIPMPLPPPDEDTTNPFALLDKPVREDERDLALHIRRMTADDPLQMAYLLAKLMRRGVDHQSGNRSLGAQMAEFRHLLETMPAAGVSELKEDVDKIEKDLAVIATSSKIIKWAGALIIGAIIGSVTYVADRISSYSETRGRQTEQIDTLRETIKDLAKDVHKLEIHDARRGKDKDKDNDP
jgi:outer membrane murein-binding lipoprotein Lpp